MHAKAHDHHAEESRIHQSEVPSLMSGDAPDSAIGEPGNLGSRGTRQIQLEYVLSVDGEPDSLSRGVTEALLNPLDARQVAPTERDLTDHVIDSTVREPA